MSALLLRPLVPVSNPALWLVGSAAPWISICTNSPRLEAAFSIPLV